MNTFRQDFDTILQLKQGGSGFHYVHQGTQLADKARQARQWYNLLKTPLPQWNQTLADTRFILDELGKDGIHAPGK